MYSTYWKRGILICSCMAIMAIVACKKTLNENFKVVNINTPFNLSISEKAIIGNNGKQITIEARSIADNRCTNSQTCTNPGNAAIRLAISNAYKNSFEESGLCIGLCDNIQKNADSVTVNLKGDIYQIILTNINADKTSKVQTAQIFVKPLN